MSKIIITKNIFNIIIKSIPLSINNMLPFLALAINFHFAGKLNNEIILSGIGLANVLINTVGNSLLYGLNIGFGSLCGIAFGAKSKDLMNNYFNKAICIVLLFALLLFILFNYSSLIFSTLGQDK